VPGTGDYDAAQAFEKAAMAWFETTIQRTGDRAVREFLTAYGNLVTQFPDLQQQAYEEGQNNGRA
jgi:hypothetical protein